MQAFVPTDMRALYDSLALFDRPERERLRGFLPRDVDIEELLDALFAPLEAADAR